MSTLQLNNTLLKPYNSVSQHHKTFEQALQARLTILNDALAAYNLFSGASIAYSLKGVSTDDTDLSIQETILFAQQKSTQTLFTCQRPSTLLHDNKSFTNTANAHKNLLYEIDIALALEESLVNYLNTYLVPSIEQNEHPAHRHDAVPHPAYKTARNLLNKNGFPFLDTSLRNKTIAAFQSSSQADPTSAHNAIAKQDHLFMSEAYYIIRAINEAIEHISLPIQRHGIKSFTLIDKFRLKQQNDSRWNYTRFKLFFGDSCSPAMRFDRLHTPLTGHYLSVFNTSNQMEDKRLLFSEHTLGLSNLATYLWNHLARYAHKELTLPCDYSTPMNNADAHELCETYVEKIFQKANISPMLFSHLKTGKMKTTLHPYLQQKLSAISKWKGLPGPESQL